MEIRPVDQIAKKWAAVTPSRSADYAAGVANPRRDWQQASVAAADAWKEGVTKAAATGSFSKGVNKATSAKWARGAKEKGERRWGEGVALAEEEYSRGMAPYVEALRRTSLPARFARRDPRNLLRVKAVVDALSKVKESSGS